MAAGRARRTAGAAGALVAACAVACAVPPAAPPAPGPFEDVRRVVATLDDVAGEYPLAAARGRVIDRARFDVLTGLLHDAAFEANDFPAAEQADVRAIGAAVAALAPADDVVAAARRLRARLIASHRLALGPAAPPSRARAELLWASVCAGCHGRAGAGDGAQGLYLDPEPKDFHEPEFMAGLSPTRAFSRITDGVRGTAMPGWGTFTADERWGLAALVFSFRHDAGAAARGAAVIAARGGARSPAALADRRDGELAAALRDDGLDAASAADAIAYLRGAAAFAPPTGPAARAQAALADTFITYRDDRAGAAAPAAAARREAAALIEAVRGCEPARAARLEDELAAFGAAVDAGALDEVIEHEAARLEVALDDAVDVARAPRAGGAIALALARAGAAAAALGWVLARRRRGGARGGGGRDVRDGAGGGALAALAGLVGGGLAGAAAPAGTFAAAAVTLAIALLIVIAAARPARAGGDGGAALALAAAAPIGLALGAAGRAAIAWAGAAAVGPLVAAAAALTAVAASAAAIERRAPAVAGVGAPVALALAAAATAGRGAWIAWTSAGGQPSAAIGWRVEALGVFPAAQAVAAACVAAAACAFAGAVAATARRAQSGR